jgi:hypothetical protein
MIPPIIEVGVKPFLYDIYFKIDDITDEGWNDESINLGKRASMDRQGLNDPSYEKTGKKARNIGDKFVKEEMKLENIGDMMSQGKSSGRGTDLGDNNEDLNPVTDYKGYDNDPINEDEEFHESEGDLLSSQDFLES